MSVLQGNSTCSLVCLPQTFQMPFCHVILRHCASFIKLLIFFIKFVKLHVFPFDFKKSALGNSEERGKKAIFISCFVDMNVQSHFHSRANHRTLKVSVNYWFRISWSDQRLMDWIFLEYDPTSSSRLAFCCLLYTVWAPLARPVSMWSLDERKFQSLWEGI